MKPIEVRTVKSSLSKKGFEAKQTNHLFYFFCFEGKKTAWWVKISHGAKEMRQREIKANAMVFGFSASDLHGVLSCEKDHEWVLAKYRAAQGR